MTYQHQTKKMKWEERRNYYRSKAKIIIEAEPQRRYLVFIGHLISALDESCGLNDGLIRKAERAIINVLASWGDFGLYKNLCAEIGKAVGKATNQKIYVDIKR